MSFIIKIREDFSAVKIPTSMMRLASPHKSGDRNYSNSAEKGYSISAVAKRKIRGAALSLYACATREEQLNLRFVTFTFPSLPESLKDKSVQEQDSFLHKLFLKFLDNERKIHNVGINGEPVRLEKYLWVNERQDGSRLKNSNNARGVIHYHALFRYSYPVNYWFANLRFLNLLFRNGFTIFNHEYLKESYREERNNVIQALITLDYDFFKNNRPLTQIEVISAEGVKKQSIFLQPVDFDKEPIEDITALSKYLSAYLTKDSKVIEQEQIKENRELIKSVAHDCFKEAIEEFEGIYSKNFEPSKEEKLEQEDFTKIYCRRWGCSQGLVIPKKEIEEKFIQLVPELIINPNPFIDVDVDTGEVLFESPEQIIKANHNGLLKIYSYDKRSIPFEIKIGKEKYELEYFPSLFDLWKQIPELREFFNQAFQFNLV